MYIFNFNSNQLQRPDDCDGISCDEAGCGGGRDGKVGLEGIRRSLIWREREGSRGEESSARGSRDEKDVKRYGMIRSKMMQIMKLSIIIDLHILSKRKVTNQRTMAHQG